MKSTHPFISITSDFGINSEGCGVMKGTVLKFCPDANVIDITHGVEPFNIKHGARELEAVACLPVGFHVCVVDPGVGTKRRGIIIKVKRGDYLIGPDNGVLRVAARILGGIEKAVEITNTKYMQHPVSPTFHGRDVFTPAAAYLANGIPMERFGKVLKEQELVPAPYEDARIAGKQILGRVTYVNLHNFNVYSSIRQKTMAEAGLRHGDAVTLTVGNNKLVLKFLRTFGEAKKGEPLVYIDDYNHIAVAINQGFFGKKYKIKAGDVFIISRAI